MKLVTKMGRRRIHDLGGFGVTGSYALDICKFGAPGKGARCEQRSRVQDLGRYQKL